MILNCEYQSIFDPSRIYVLTFIADDHVQLMYVNKPHGGGYVMSLGINAFKKEFRPTVKTLILQGLINND